MVKTANSTIGSLISSEGSLLCTDTCNGKVYNPDEKKYPQGEIKQFFNLDLWSRSPLS